MDYPGITTHEPTLLGLLAILAVITTLTYPCSLMLILLGVVKPAENGSNAFSRVFRRANEILFAQLVPFVIAWFVGCFACTILFLGYGLIGGLLVAIGLMQPVDSIICVPLLAVLGGVHLIAQIIAYRYAIKESSWIEKPRHPSSDLCDSDSAKS